MRQRGEMTLRMTLAAKRAVDELTFYDATVLATLQKMATCYTELAMLRDDAWEYNNCALFGT